jgi:hypothetical protein
VDGNPQPNDWMLPSDERDVLHDGLLALITELE